MTEPCSSTSANVSFFLLQAGEQQFAICLPLVLLDAAMFKALLLFVEQRASAVNAFVELAPVIPIVRRPR
jgi:hypothetical protein